MVVEKRPWFKRASGLGNKWTYDTADHAGEIAANGDRQIDADFPVSKGNIALIKVIPSASTSTTFEIYNSNTYNTEYRVFRATGIGTGTDILNTVPSGINGLVFQEVDGNNKIHIYLNETSGTASNYLIKLWYI